LPRPPISPTTTWKGLPFRDAHEAVGLAVKTAEFKGVDLPGLTLEELQQFSPSKMTFFPC
jgi:argininosuccinate lyase